MTEEKIICPFCGKDLEPGYLYPTVDVGPYNFLRGFSVGTKTILKWSKNHNGLAAKSLNYYKAYEGYKCEKCDSILFSPFKGFTSKVDYPHWFKVIAFISVGLTIVFAYALLFK